MAGSSRCCPRQRCRDPFERIFGTAHGVDLGYVAASTGTPYTFVNEPGQLSKALRGEGLRIVEVRTDRESNAESCTP